MARMLRSFSRGFLAILLAIYLDLIGFSVIQITAFISLGLMGAAFFNIFVVFFGDTLGRRRLMVFFTLLMAVAGLVLAVTDNFLLLALGAFLAGLTLGGGGGGPVQPLESATLPETAPAARRTDLFAFVMMMGMGSSALGALAAGLPAIFQDSLSIGEVSSYKMMFVAYALLTVLGALVYSFLSPAVEVRSPTGRRWTNPLRLPSRRTIFGLVGIFSIDHFGTSLVVESLVALWFKEKFGLELGEIAFVFFGFSVMAALSMWIAAKLANRFGLINIIVFTHVPPTVALMVMPFIPFAWLAATVWVARGFFNLMDVPTKQSYTMGVVASHERSAMSGINNVTRSSIGAVSPTLAGVLWQVLDAGAPFLAGGAVKSAYLLTFFLRFRNVKPPEERREAEREAAAPQAGTGGPPRA